MKVIAEGDSISVFWAGNYTGLFATAHPSLAFSGSAQGGSWIGDPSERGTSANSLWARLDANLAKSPTHMTVLIGANDLITWQDLAGNITDPANWLARLFGYTDTLRAAGVKVAVGTILPQCLTNDPNFLPLFKVRRAAANVAIRAAATSGRIDGVIDFAADNRFGDDADACNLTLYHDGLHPVDGIQPQLAEVYGPAVETLIQR